MKKAADDVPALLKRLQAWLKKHRKTYAKGLRPPATKEELADLGKDLGAEPPPDLAALLSWHNGQDDDVFGGFVDDWRLMSAAQIAKARQELAGGGEKAWRSGFVPFLEDDRGDVVAVDTADGSVREFRGGAADTPVLGPSLRAWLKQFVEDVEAGEYVEDPERGGFAKKS